MRLCFSEGYASRTPTEEGGVDCAFEVSAASSDLPGASDCALASLDATNVQDKHHFQEPPRACRGGVRAHREIAAGKTHRAAQWQARFWGCGEDQVLQGAAGAARVAPPPEEPEESKGFLKDVAAAMAEEITGAAGRSRAALAAGWTARCGRGGSPLLASAAGHCCARTRADRRLRRGGGTTTSRTMRRRVARGIITA